MNTELSQLRTRNWSLVEADDHLNLKAYELHYGAASSQIGTYMLKHVDVYFFIFIYDYICNYIYLSICTCQSPPISSDVFLFSLCQSLKVLEALHQILSTLPSSTRVVLLEAQVTDGNVVALLSGLGCYQMKLR